MKVQPIDAHEQADVRLEGARGVKKRMLIGPEDGAPNFHMRHFEVAAGGHTPYHEHAFEHEVLVLAGKGTARSEQGTQPVKPGDVVFVRPGEMHQFVAAKDEALQFICLIPAPQDSGQ